MSEERTLEVHARKRMPVPDGFDSSEYLLSELEDAIDRASDQDRMTWLTEHGRRIAAVVPVEQAGRGQITAEQQATLTTLTGQLLGMVNQKVAPRGHEITRERWEIAVRGILAQVFQQGANWEAARSLEP